MTDAAFQSDFNGGRKPAWWRGVTGAAVIVVVALGAAFAIDLARQAGGGEDLVPWEAGLERGQAVAAQTGKPMLVNFTADWCGPCQHMKRTVFSQPHVAETIEASFVPVKVDMTSPDPHGPEVAAEQRYGVSGFPTLLVLAPDGEPVSMRLGGQSEADLLTWLEAVR